MSSQQVCHNRQDTVRKGSGRCPYRGLAAFEEEHAQHFFGRQEEVRRLLSLLQQERLLALTGVTGSGKSSLIRAGLVPAVKSGQLAGSRHWRVVVMMRPGPRPCHELALRLAQFLSEDSSRAAQYEASLRARASTLSDSIHQALLEQPGSPRLLLVVDSFEELFTLVKDREERKAFIDNLLHAGTVPEGRIHVLLGLRADSLGRCLASPALARHLGTGHRIIHVRSMNEQELQEAIQRPALKEGLQFEVGLVDVLVAGGLDQPGNLPRLQYMLEALWALREGDTMTLKAYRQLRVLAGAIYWRTEGFLSEDHQVREHGQAQKEFAEARRPPESRESVTRRLWMGLVGVGGQGIVALSLFLWRIIHGRSFRAPSPVS